jgi:hypothetical protein
LFKNERVGQAHSNQIDWKIAALNGLGLLLFFVPGVIAFAVDFWTGAIYLPLEEHYPGYGAGGGEPHPAPMPQAPMQESLQLAPPGGLGLKRVVIPRNELQLERIQQIVAEHVGREVRLDNRDIRVHRFERIDEFDAALQSAARTS